jgi:hypothetical protein
MKETWFRTEPIDDTTVNDTEVEIEYSRRSGIDGRVQTDEVTLSREQLERFLTEAGYEKK